jgi:MoaA/NifB/PqqE/SkfB family radical SAM enzyme
MYSGTELYFFEPEDVEEFKGKGKFVINDNFPENSMSAPLSFQLAITNNRNVNCFNCYNKGNEHCGDKRELGTNQKKELIDYLVDWGVLFFQWSGGEPFLAKDLVELAEYAKGKNLSQSLLTNGLLLKRRDNAEWASKVFQRVQISFNAVDRFKEWTGANAFDVLIVGMENISECCAKQGVSFNITTTINELSIAEFEKIAYWVDKINPTHWRIGEEVPLGKAGAQIGHMELLEKSYEIFLTLKGKYGRENWHHCFEVTEADPLMPVEWQSSPAGRTMLYMSAIGEVYPFPYLKMPEFRLGRYPEDDLREIWYNSSALAHLRSVHYGNTLCAGCKNICVRWAREINYHFNKNVFESPTPFTSCPRQLETERR